MHVSITNPDPQSNLPYFWGKAILEEDLIASGMSYAILRPTVIFGKEDILINNIAWFLRRFPVFTLPGDGEYRLQPIYVADLAKLAAEQAVKRRECDHQCDWPGDVHIQRYARDVEGLAIDSRSLLVPSPPGFGALAVLGRRQARRGCRPHRAGSRRPDGRAACMLMPPLREKPA